MTDQLPYSGIFETDNARNETPETLGKRFVWTKSFNRLVTPKNHVVLGSRGSGKTALVKMLSHPYLANCPDRHAKQLIAKRKFVGCYVPMRIEWVGGLRNKSWLSTQQQLELFEWRLNLASCLAFLRTIRSCIRSYVPQADERLRIEMSLSRSLSSDLLDQEISSFFLLERAIEDLEFKKQKALLSSGIRAECRSSDIGIAFHSPLFSPLKRMIVLLKRNLRFPDDTAWIVALDEAEFLTPDQQKALNSSLRSDNSQIFFKITTMPYCHYTLDTITSVPVVHHDDFDYVYIDSAFSQADQSATTQVQNFLNGVISRRITEALHLDNEILLGQLLGYSHLLGEKVGPQEEFGLTNERLMFLIEKHCNAATISRAQQLSNTSSFRDQIQRKLSGALLLRETIATLKGAERLKLYSGQAIFARCSDGNPRRAISLLNSMLLVSDAPLSTAGFRPIPAASQNVVYERFSKSYLNRLRHEQSDGMSLYDLITVIGNALHAKSHIQQLGTDQYGSIRISEPDLALWELIKKAVGLGALFPIVNSSQPDELPELVGSFRLAYVFAPHFRILPRKGRPVGLHAILKDRSSQTMVDSQPQLGLL